MDYEKKYEDLISGLNKCIPDISNNYPNCNGFEKAVISMRKENWNYGDIQKKLGMPSKKQIRNVLLKWAPELIDNSKSKAIKVSNYESEIYNILVHTNKTEFEIEGENWNFYIKDKQIYVKDAWGSEDKLSVWNEINQHQFLIAIKQQI